MSALILDLDNCIADDGWRIRYINWKHPDLFVRYHQYHSLSPWDQIGNRELFQSTPHRVFILTARPVLYREMTEEWLRRNGVTYAAMLMRNNHDTRHGVALKMA